MTNIMQITIDRHGAIRNFNKHYNFGVGSCHAATALRHDYVKQLKKLKEDVDIQYVRFHGVFNDDMHTLDTLDDVLDVFPNGENHIERNFYLVGVAYDNLLECGVKPFVELGFMPQGLAKHKTTTKGFYGSNMNEPKNYDEWAEYIESFIEFLIHRYGEEEVETWYFEVWNEPDLYGAFFLGDQDAYFKLYKYTVKAIKSVNPRLRVGGPSTSASRWIQSFKDYCEEENLPLDFLSTHQYPGDPFTGVSEDELVTDPNEKADKLKRNIELLQNLIPKDASPLEVLRIMFGDPTETKDIRDNVFRDNAKYARSIAKEIPLFYTEWNLTAVFTAYSNDTKKSASYITKTALDVEPYVDGTSLWAFSDIFEEMHQFKEEFHGGFGLQTIHGIPKPSYYSMKFLNQVSNDRYYLGENATQGEVGYGAFKGDVVDHIFLFRHHMKTKDLDLESVNIKLINAKKPKKVTITKIDDKHCNPLKLWEDKGSPKYLKPYEVDEIIKDSSDIETVLEYEFEDGVINFTDKLGVNDTHFIKVYW